MGDRLFDVRAYAQDALSNEKKMEFQNLIQADMIAKEVLATAATELDLNMFNVEPDTLPESDAELELYMNMHYKPALEIAEEEGINTLLEMSHYKSRIRNRINYDLTTLGIGFVKHEFMPGSGVEVKYVDPATLVYSYTESPTFDDCFYYGEVKQVPITELVKINPNITNEEMKEIAQLSTLWYNYYGIIRPYQDTLFREDTVTLLFFNYKTTKNMVYKKKKLENGVERIILKTDDFNPPEEVTEKFEKLSKRIEIWYEGIMVMGSPKMLKWELAKNMVRPKSASQVALLAISEHS